MKNPLQLKIIVIIHIFTSKVIHVFPEKNPLENKRFFYVAGIEKADYYARQLEVL
jgi:hypothetical protein